jgi:hypothetical protein
MVVRQFRWQFRCQPRNLFAPLFLIASVYALVSGCASGQGALNVIQRQDEGVRAIRPESPIPDKVWPSGISYDPDAKKGVLDITSAPSGAEVFLNEKFIGTTPVEIKDSPEAFYRIRILKNGFREYATSFHFEEKQNHQHAILERITGLIELSVSPPQAIVTRGAEEPDNESFSHACPEGFCPVLDFHPAG